ncbi:MAG: right-handed parallel beta-helix repeat-containing protein, partial [Ginsengibacter sp.]
SSAPSAGIDIEAEVGPIRNGIFTNCEFINNAGAGVVASAGDSENCIFTDCTFWGVTNWSIWVTKPAFTFKGCNIYGAIVHGYNSPDDKNATKFIRCIFEDKPYQGKEAYGNFLVETNNVKRMSFTDCKFIANKKRLYWISIDPAIKPEERYQFSNCLFVLNNADDSTGVMIGLLKGAVLKNCSFTFKNPELKKKGLSFLRFKEGDNIDYGGNKTIY